MKGQPARRKALARADLIDDIIVWLRNTKRMWMGAGDLVRARRMSKAWVLLRTIKRLRASSGCLGVERR